MKEKTLIAKISSLSSKRDGTYYEVSKEACKWICSCPGYTNHGHCKHIKLLKSGDYPGDVYLTMIGRSHFLYNDKYKNGW